MAKFKVTVQQTVTQLVDYWVEADSLEAVQDMSPIDLDGECTTKSDPREIDIEEFDVVSIKKSTVC